MGKEKTQALGPSLAPWGQEGTAQAGVSSLL